MSKAKQSARKSLSDALREAMNDCGMTRYKISQLTGLNQSMLGRFAAGTRDLQMKSAERLAEAIGVELVVRRKPKA